MGAEIVTIEQLTEFFKNLSPDDLRAFSAAMQQTRNDGATTPRIPKSRKNGKSAKSDGGIRKSSGPGPTFSVRQTKELKSASIPNRPLNSWMAFRSYYAGMFKSYQQKDISGFLKVIWTNDPYKAKWAIIAKAYSMIRGKVTKDKIPLDGFLDIVAPPAGALSREDYLPVMGWMLIEEHGFQVLKRTHEPTPGMIPQSYRTTMTSPNQLIALCVQNGMITMSDLSDPAVDAANMSMATQPATTHQTPAGSSPFANNTFDGNGNFDASTAYAQYAMMNNNSGMVGNAAPYLGMVYDGFNAGNPSDFYDAFNPFGGVDVPTFSPAAGNYDDVFNIGSTGMYTAPPVLANPADLDVDKVIEETMAGFNAASW